MTARDRYKHLVALEGKNSLKTHLARCAWQPWRYLLLPFAIILGTIVNAMLKLRTKSSSKYGGIGGLGVRVMSGHLEYKSERVRIGEGSYGSCDLLLLGNGDSKLIVGNYCSIASDVVFLVEAEHSYKSVSTYPFRVKLGYSHQEARSKGSIVVGDDVWIGHGAIICSGVTIGQGAVIAAGSVVVKDVEPYSIVGGNPARHIKYRYDDPALRAKMSKLDWSTFDMTKVTAESVDRLYANVTHENFDSIVNEFFGKEGGRP